MYYIGKIKYLCFSYSEPSSGQRQNEVLVHSMNVHSVGSHIVYNFNDIINHMLTYWLISQLHF